MFLIWINSDTVHTQNMFHVEHLRKDTTLTTLYTTKISGDNDTNLTALLIQ